MTRQLGIQLKQYGASLINRRDQKLSSPIILPTTFPTLLMYSIDDLHYAALPFPLLSTRLLCKFPFNPGASSSTTSRFVYDPDGFDSSPGDARTPSQL